MAQDPLEFIDYIAVVRHGDPAKWKRKGEKPGSGVPAKSGLAPPGTLKIYEIFEDEYGQEIELHYFRHLDGSVSGVKVTPRS